jgi:hypothetical protein
VSDLKAFLKPSVAEITNSVIVSNRFADEDGKPATFEIKSITQTQNDALIKASTKTIQGKRGQREEIFNKIQYQSRLVVECTVMPNFRDPQLLQTYGVIDPLEAPGKMLLSGEFAKLADAIMVVNGFEEEDPEALREEAKN